MIFNFFKRNDEVNRNNEVNEVDYDEIDDDNEPSTSTSFSGLWSEENDERFYNYFNGQRDDNESEEDFYDRHFVED